MADVSDVTLINIARLDQVSGGLVGKLITERLFAVGFGIGPYANAVAFFEPIEAIIAQVRHKRLN